jgi:hypothetical protein
MVAASASGMDKRNFCTERNARIRFNTCRVMSPPMYATLLDGLSGVTALGPSLCIKKNQPA